MIVWKITDCTILDTTFGRNNCDNDSVGFVVVRNMSVNMDNVTYIVALFFICLATDFSF
jgi:hypothetical protein